MPDQAHNPALDQIEKIDHSKYGRSHRSRRRTMKIVLLSVALSVSLLALLVLSIYTSATISTLNENNRTLQRDLEQARGEIAALQPQLEESRANLEDLVQRRFPSLKPLVEDEVLKLNDNHMKNVVFTVVKEGNESRYKYLLLMENVTTTKIKPSFKVLLFDQYGVHIATDQVEDNRDLEPGESRDYTSDLEFLVSAAPKHFFIEDLTAQEPVGRP